MDNRVQFPATEIDFTDNTTGQDHDTFPAPGQQPRYDWMRSALQGLLACQSSEDPPTQYRTGTVWYNTTKQVYYIYNGVEWVSLAEAILMLEASSSGSTSLLTLSDWYTLAQSKLDTLQNRLVFAGRCVTDGKTEIPIPSAIQERIEDADMVHPFVYLNGVLIDPRNTRLSEGCATTVELLNGEDIDNGDKFTVVIQRIDYLAEDEVLVS
jgi:hypothetical protein